MTRAPLPIAERIGFDPRYDLTRYEQAMTGEISHHDLDQLWRLPDGSTATERELLEAEGGMGGPQE